MDTESTKRAQKLLEYQEAGLALRSAEQVRRKSVTFYGVTSTIPLLSFIYYRDLPADTCAYLSLAGSLLSFMSYLLFREYTNIIEYTTEQLLTLQVAIGASVYPSSVRAGLSERDFYRFIYGLVALVFLATSIYYVRDASARHQLLFQSCSPYAEIAPGEEDVACPCGGYPTKIQDACPLTPPPKEQDTCKVIPFSDEWKACPRDVRVIKKSSVTVTVEDP